MEILGKLKRYMFLLVLPVFIFTGCTSAERARMTVSSMQPLMDNMRSAVNRHNDVDLVRDAMPASLIQLDGFIEVSPGNPNLLLRAAEANSGYAFLFLVDTDKKRALKSYQKAKGYAFRALRHKNAFAEILKNGSDAEITRFMDRFNEADVPALYFFATSWLSCIELSVGDDVNVIADLPKVELIMDKILELDDTYNYGAIHAVFGTYFSSRPQELGGQLEDAKFHFEEAFEISESKFLAWQFLYAKSYVVQMKDRELFIQTLEDIIAAPENLLPEKTFVNEAVKQNAKELLNKVDYLF
jgi:tetratricopeptide (TPR) repeat protein